MLCVFRDKCLNQVIDFLSQHKLVPHSHSDRYNMRLESANATGHQLVKLAREKDGAFYATIGVGSPAQYYTAVISTLTSHIVVPCAGCSSCGNHHTFNYNDSRTVLHSHYIHSSCIGNDCFETLSYSDYICLGDKCGQRDRVFFPFKCAVSYDKTLRDQTADGILGLGGSSIWRAHHHSYEAHVLSFCLGKKTGFLTIGGVHEPLLRQELMWVHSQFSFYHSASVMLTEVSLGDEGVIHTHRRDSTGNALYLHFETGYPYSYFPKSLFQATQQVLAEFLRKKKKGFDQTQSTASYQDVRDTVGCFEKPRDVQVNAWLMDTFPMLTFEMDKGQHICIPPAHYMFASGETAYCVGIIQGKSSSTITLGALLMTDLTLVHDHLNHRIGFARSDCDEDGGENFQCSDISTSSPTPSPVSSSSVPSPWPSPLPSPLPSPMPSPLPSHMLFATPTTTSPTFDPHSQESSSSHSGTIILVLLSLALAGGIFLCRARSKARYSTLPLPMTTRHQDEQMTYIDPTPDPDPVPSRPANVTTQHTAHTTSNVQREPLLHDQEAFHGAYDEDDPLGGRSA